MSQLAPVVLFTFNRLPETIRTVEALQNNFLSRESELFVFSDGPKNEAGVKKVNDVRKYLKTIDGFKKVIIYESQENKGLANSIIDGVTKIIEQFGKVIVLEDDLVTSPNFLEFMNQALDYYENSSKVISVSGYTLNLPSLNNYHLDYYIGYRASSLGWGTWIKKWNNIDWNVSDYSSFKKDYSQQLKFYNLGSDMPGMLKNQMRGKIDSWAIRWCYHQFKQDLVTVFSAKSKINHIGDGEDATNASGAIKFDTPLDIGQQRKFNFNSELEVNSKLIKEFKSKFSIKTRAMGKLKRLLSN